MDDQPPDVPDNRSRANLVALGFIVLLFLGAWWVFDAMQRHRQIENCIASGRRDCVPLVPSDGKPP